MIKHTLSELREFNSKLNKKEGIMTDIKTIALLPILEYIQESTKDINREISDLEVSKSRIKCDYEFDIISIDTKIKNLKKKINTLEENEINISKLIPGDIDE